MYFDLKYSWEDVRWAGNLKKARRPGGWLGRTSDRTIERWRAARDARPTVRSHVWVWISSNSN